jgi:hypothetical protein
VTKDFETAIKQAHQKPIYRIESLLKQNPKILNPRPHHWQFVTQTTLKAEAETRLAEMREGARKFGLPYRYRLRTL